MRTMFNVREIDNKLGPIVRCYRTEIKALDVDCFRCRLDCILAPFADITT